MVSIATLGGSYLVGTIGAVATGIVILTVPPILIVRGAAAGGTMAYCKYNKVSLPKPPVKANPRN